MSRSFLSCRALRFLLLHLLVLMTIGAGCGGQETKPMIRPMPAYKAIKAPPPDAYAPEDAAPTDDLDTFDDGNYQSFTPDRLDALQKANKPVLLYFYAAWCPTCKEQDPRLVTLLKKTTSTVTILRVNYKDYTTSVVEDELAKKYNVTSQHTFILLDKTGQELKRVIGTQSDQQIDDLIKIGEGK